MTKEKLNQQYGFFGWREFQTNRSELLSEFDRSKSLNQSRPVKVEHGTAGEAVVRKWLEEFLPSKYNITSGYIIPDTIVTDNYKLYHYDVIVFDRENAPTLWIDGNYDSSAQGRRRAIPAKYVKAVAETKARFSKADIVKTTAKLKELNSIAQFLPPTFFSFAVFFELDNSADYEVLKELVPDDHPVGFWGGLVLRSQHNKDMAGQIHFLNPEKEKPLSDVPVPLSKDIDQLNIFLNQDNNPVIGEQGAGLTCFAYEDKWHFICLYTSLHGWEWPYW